MRVRPVRGAAHSHSPGYSQRGIGILRSSYPRSCITTPQYPLKSPAPGTRHSPVTALLVTPRIDMQKRGSWKSFLISNPAAAAAGLPPEPLPGPGEVSLDLRRCIVLGL